MGVTNVFLTQGSTDVYQYAPIARALHRLDDSAAAITKRKFDIAYVIAKNNLAFQKMGPLCELEERHGVDLGQGYKNNLACAEFIDFIALEQQQNLAKSLSKARFFSLQADSSTDSGNVEDEVFLVVFCDLYSPNGKVGVTSQFLTVRRPNSCTAQGLFTCLQAALSYVGIPNWDKRLIGFGCDGASVNIGGRGLKGLLRDGLPWIVVFWCLAHRLELAIKDALKSSLFSQIDELLLRIYYLYEKAPKKCRELDRIVEELKECLGPEDMSYERGNRPRRACGTRFVCHKLVALDRFVDRYGAYITHLTSLTEDRALRAADKQKITGYVRKWRCAKMLLGCAYFYDLLRPLSVLCKALQADEVCVVSAMESLLKTGAATERVRETAVEDLPTLKKVCSRVKKEGSTYTYQGADLTGYTEAIAFLAAHHQEHADTILACLKNRMVTEECELLTHALSILATQGWGRGDNASFGYAALQYIAARFQAPLESANIDTSKLQGEWDEVVDYATKYLNIATEENNTILWKLSNCPQSKEWPNILGVFELLLCLPMSNGHLERVFSQLKLIKSDRRTSLSENRLDSLLRVVTTGPQLPQWDPSGAFDLWWREKRRRNVEDSRAPPKRQQRELEETADEQSYNLDDWENWVSND